MNGYESERKIRNVGRQRGVTVSFDPGHGKGSHGRLYYGNRFTTLRIAARKSARACSKPCWTSLE